MVVRFEGLLFCLLFSLTVSHHDDLRKYSADAKERLARLFDNIDTLRDGELDQDELVAWITKAFKRADKKTAQDTLQRLDLNNDGYVSAGEFLSDTFGYTPQEVEAMRKDNSHDSRQILESIDDEMERFTTADVNNDEHLDAEELIGFNSPFHYPHMVPYVVNETMRYQDYNGDRQLTLEEYLGVDRDDKFAMLAKTGFDFRAYLHLNVDTKDSQVLEYEKDKFSQMDKNDDGYVDADELRAYYNDESAKFAQIEATHLFAESDLNSDGKLTRGEVAEAFQAWLDSPATDHGKLLQRDNLEYLSQDEGFRDEL